MSKATYILILTFVIWAICPHDTLSQEEGLVLQSDFDKDNRFYGEPILVRVRLVNRGEREIVVPFSRYGAEATLFFEITDDAGKNVVQYRSERDSIGPRPLRIGKGQEHIEIFNLYEDFGIKESGNYKISLSFASKGEYYEIDKESGRRVGKPGWKGTLVANVGTAVIVEPTRREDRAALEVLRAFPPAFFDRDKRATLIEKHPDSHYTAYAHYYEALEELHRYRDFKGEVFAKRAFEHLAKIDESKYGALFRELVTYARVQALSGMGEKVKAQKAFEDFKKTFPKTPYALPSDN